MPNNDILHTFVTAGASAQTAKQDRLPAGGRQASETMAETDLRRVRPLMEKFNATGLKADLPPALLAAIASRESRCGNVLDPDGFGDGKHAFGIMQVDKRSHNPEGLPDPRSQRHLDQAAGILKAALVDAQRKFPNEPPARQLQAAVAAYNCGINRVESPSTADNHTTAHDYSNDVWMRAAFYARNWPMADDRPIDQQTSPV